MHRKILIFNINSKKIKTKIIDFFSHVTNIDFDNCVIAFFFFFLKRCNDLITYILTQQIEGKKRGGMQE